MAIKGTKAVQYEVADAGEYPCVLLSIKEDKRTPYGSAEGAAKTEDCIVFTFETVGEDNLNSQGLPYRFVKSTGTQYGSERAALTKMVADLVGRKLTKEEYDDDDVFNESMVVGKRFFVTVNVSDNSDYNNIVMVRRPKPKPKQVVAEEDETPPASQNKAAVKTKKVAAQEEDEPDDLKDPFKDEE